MPAGPTFLASELPAAHEAHVTHIKPCGVGLLGLPGRTAAGGEDGSFHACHCPGAGSGCHELDACCMARGGPGAARGDDRDVEGHAVDTGAGRRQVIAEATFSEEPASDEHDEDVQEMPAARRTPRAYEKAVPTRRRTAPVASSSSLILPPTGHGYARPKQAPKRQEQAPDPFVDITRLRVRSRGSHCLYPGASFQGIQRSGNSTYDVSVQILDVDLPSSFLCGYLCIRGLTEDWPEMTTYFDAEVIGSKHGFITDKWGASEQDDHTHWNRFPAFKNVRHELTGPHLHLPEHERGAVFMRWKERFLVPDHRVQDVNGASFAGMYYICVDFDGRSAADVPRSPTKGQDGLLAPGSPTATKISREAMPDAVNRRTSSSFGGARGAPTMTGYYFHSHSEPYQQISLTHLPQVSQSGYEFR